MFKDLKEYQEITRIYNESVNISEEQRAINKIFIEEGFTSEEIEWLEENFDELWENELAQYTQECIVESFEGQNLTEEQVQQLDEVLGLGMAAKGIMKAAPAISKGLRKANVGIKKGLKAVGKKVSGGAKAIGTGIKDTARGALSVGKSALKKVGGAIKKAAPIIGKGALLATGAALPVAAVGGIVKGVNALRKRGKAKREAGKAAADAALDAKIKAGIEKSGMGTAGTAITAAGAAQAQKNREEFKKKKNLQKAGEAGQKAAENIKSTTTKPKKMHPIEKKNRARFGDEKVDKLKAKQVDFKAMRKGTMSKDDFIKKYPKSITAQKAAGLRDHTEWDAYDMVLEYLFSTEQVSTLEEANYVMMEMDQQTVGEIVTEVKQELHELLPLAGLALGGLAVNALRKRGKAKRMGKAAKSAGMAPAGAAAGRTAKGGGAAGKAAKAIASGASGAGGAVGKAAGSLAKSVGGSVGKAAGSIASGMSGGAAGKIGAMGAAGATRKPKPQAGTGRPSPRPPHGRRRDGGSIGGGIPPKPEAKKIDLSGKTKAQIMALKRLGKI